MPSERKNPRKSGKEKGLSARDKYSTPAVRKARAAARAEAEAKTQAAVNTH